MHTCSPAPHAASPPPPPRTLDAVDVVQRVHGRATACTRRASGRARKQAVGRGHRGRACPPCASHAPRPRPCPRPARAPKQGGQHGALVQRDLQGGQEGGSAGEGRGRRRGGLEQAGCAQQQQLLLLLLMGHAPGHLLTMQAAPHKNSLSLSHTHTHTHTHMRLAHTRGSRGRGMCGWCVACTAWGGPPLPRTHTAPAAPAHPG